MAFRNEAVATEVYTIQQPRRTLECCMLIHRKGCSCLSGLGLRPYFYLPRLLPLLLFPRRRWLPLLFPLFGDGISGLSEGGGVRQQVIVVVHILLVLLVLLVVLVLLLGALVPLLPLLHTVLFFLALVLVLALALALGVGCAPRARQRRQLDPWPMEGADTSSYNAANSGSGYSSHGPHERANDGSDSRSGRPANACPANATLEGAAVEHPRLLAAPMGLGLLVVGIPQHLLALLRVGDGGCRFLELLRHAVGFECLLGRGRRGLEALFIGQALCFFDVDVDVNVLWLWRRLCLRGCHFGRWGWADTL